MKTKKKIIGILGGIASGKSAVAAEFKKLGCAVIDADQIAHTFLENTEIKIEIRCAFGPEPFDPQGRVRTDKLAQIVFRNQDNVSRINEIIHPPVIKQCDTLIKKIQANPEIQAIVLDIPLLLEVQWHKRCDKLIFVDCPLPLRLENAKKKGFLSEKQLKKRENFQISLDTKAEIADYIIQNNSDLSALAGQVARILASINDVRCV